MQHKPRTCIDCGHPVTRGWAGGRPADHARYCLICLTAQVMATFRWRPKRAR